MGNRPPRVAQGDGDAAPVGDSLARAAASADFQNIEGKLTGCRADVYSTRFPDSGAFTELCGQNLRPVPEPSTTRETPRPHQQSPTPALSQPGQTHPLPVWERSRTPAPRPRGSASPAEPSVVRSGGVCLRWGVSAPPRSSRPSDAPHVGGPAACVHRPRTDTRVASALRRLLQVTPPWTLLDTYLSEPFSVLRDADLGARSPVTWGLRV